ncbi:MAG: MBL fold metallo-hydrolase [Chloroflexi bacterium]|nr:MBL fold metallo-hydrolase [Chloroflexota bacterium]
MDATELMIRHTVVGLIQANCYIVGSRRTGEAICIDPGDEVGEVQALAREMKVSIKKIVCTHGHLDHIMAVRALQEETGAPYLLHADDLEIARRMPASAPRMFGRHERPSPEPDDFLAHDDTVGVAGVDLKVIHTPGHTPGSVCFYTDGVLFSGDTLFQGSVGKFDSPDGSFERIMISIMSRLMPLPEDTVVRPGHMDQTTIGFERRHNPLVQQILEAMRAR